MAGCCSAGWFTSRRRPSNARKQVPKQLNRKAEKERRAFARLRKRRFSCRADAEEALAVFAQKLQATTVEAETVLECQTYNWPVGRWEPEQVCYGLAGHLRPSKAARTEQILRRSLFILTTNALDPKALSPAALLEAYKGQAQVERGFRFLKDPLFLAASLFLRNEKRIMALLMVMTLCLLVYAALEWRVREGLRQQAATVPDQKGKPTQRPTARAVGV